MRPLDADEAAGGGGPRARGGGRALTRTRAPIVWAAVAGGATVPAGVAVFLANMCLVIHRHSPHALAGAFIERFADDVARASSDADPPASRR